MFFNNFFRHSKRILLYVIAISALGLIAIPGIFMIMRESFTSIIFVFTCLILIYLCFLAGFEANKIGVKEKLNPKLYKAHPIKGFLYGLVAELPVWLITLILSLSKDSIFELFVQDFRNYLANIFTLQFLPILSSMGFTLPSYIISIAIIPLVCGVSYYLGMKGFSFEFKFGSINK